ncbi:MAG TPA: hypothetical protein VJA94_12980 [Candidatus Angelobacter sp.]
MRKISGITFLSLFFLFSATVHAQQADIAFGVGTVTAPSAFDATGDFFPQSVGGGVFPSFSGDVLFLHHFGVGGNVSWRATRNLSQGFLPFRPIFYDFNAVFAPPLGKHAAAQLEGGIGGESVRFYQGFVTCSFFSCTDFVSTNHFLGHVGGGIKFYVFHNFFIRPEAHFYFIHNNVEFSGNHATRVGASIGYTFRGPQ